MTAPSGVVIRPGGGACCATAHAPTATEAAPNSPRPMRPITVSPLLRQRKRDQRFVVGRLAFGCPARRRKARARGHHRDILPPVLALVADWNRQRRVVELLLPQNLAGLRIESAEITVGRGADEHEATGCDDRPARAVVRAGILLALRQVFRDAEAAGPEDVAGVAVDRDQPAPRRLETRKGRLLAFGRGEAGHEAGISARA